MRAAGRDVHNVLDVYWSGQFLSRACYGKDAVVQKGGQRLSGTLQNRPFQAPPAFI